VRKKRYFRRSRIVHFFKALSKSPSVILFYSSDGGEAGTRGPTPTVPPNPRHGQDGPKPPPAKKPKRKTVPGNGDAGDDSDMEDGGSDLEGGASGGGTSGGSGAGGGGGSDPLTITLQIKVDQEVVMAFLILLAQIAEVLEKIEKHERSAKK